MRSDMSTIGILFDIDKLEEKGSYGKEAWVIFWKAMIPDHMQNLVELWEGDTQEGGVFCIAIQSFDTSNLRLVRSKLEKSKEFKKVTTKQSFIEGTTVMKEYLSHVGRIDSNGNLIGDDDELFNARSALQSLSYIEQDKKKLIDELIMLANEANTWGKKHKYPRYERYPQYEKIRKMGEKLYNIGGMELMEQVYYQVNPQVQYPGFTEWWWQDIGGWRA